MSNEVIFFGSVFGCVLFAYLVNRKIFNKYIINIYKKRGLTLTVNGKEEKMSPEKMVDFWQGFVEGLSKALHVTQKQLRTTRTKLKEAESIIIDGAITQSYDDAIKHVVRCQKYIELKTEKNNEDEK